MWHMSEVARPGFLRRLGTTLDASDSLVEVLIGLVVIVGVTSSSRLGFVDPALGDNPVLKTALLTAIVWAIIDASFFLILSLYRQGRIARLVRLARHNDGRDDSAFLREVDAVAGGSVSDIVSASELERILRIVGASTELVPRRPRLTSSDWMSALASMVAMLLATLPPVIPFLFPLPAWLALAISNLISVASLYWVGWFWARWTDYPRWLCGIAAAFIGIAMVAFTLIFDVA